MIVFCVWCIGLQPSCCYSTFFTGDHGDIRNPEATDEIIAEVRSAYVDVYNKLKEAEKIVIEYKGEK